MDDELRQKQMQYHRDVISWHQVALDAHEAGLPEELIYRHSLPINVRDHRLILSYINSLAMEILKYSETIAIGNENNWTCQEYKGVK